MTIFWLLGYVLFGEFLGYFAWSIYHKNKDLPRRGFWFNFLWPMKIVDGYNHTEWIEHFRTRFGYVLTMTLFWPAKLLAVLYIISSIVVLYIVLFLTALVFSVIYLNHR